MWGLLLNYKITDILRAIIGLELTLTSLAPQSCILFSASAAVVFPVANNAITVSATKQENEDGFSMLVSWVGAVQAL